MGHPVASCCTYLANVVWVIWHLLPQFGEESCPQKIPRVPDGADAEHGEVAILGGGRLVGEGGHQHGQLFSGVIEESENFSS